MQKRFGSGSMVLPSPRDVDAVIRGVRRGDLITVSQVCHILARKYDAAAACPLVTGMFVRLAAEAAEEDAAEGRKRITPYWRVVKDDGGLNPKFPGGVARQEERLREEGHTIRRGAGKRPPRVAMGI